MNMNGLERLPLCSVLTGSLPENTNAVIELSSNIEEQPDEWLWLLMVQMDLADGIRDALFIRMDELE